MTAAAGLGAIATLVSIAFALSTLERWRANRRPHELAWTIAMMMFAAASLAYFAGAALGWGEVSFRTFYLFGAILNVPYLALGTIYLLGGVALGRRVQFWLNLTAAFCAGVVLSASITGTLDVEGIPSGKEVFGLGPRIMAAVGSGVGAIVLIGGAIWSAAALARLQRRPSRESDPTIPAGRLAKRRPSKGDDPTIPAGRLALTNVLIALGSIVLGTGGTLFGTGDQMVDFGIWLAVGISILFAGFLVSNPARPPAPARSMHLTPYWNEIYELVAD